MISCILLCAATSALAAEKKGFLVTNDSKRITGEIVSIYYSVLGCRVVFKNDYGTEYELNPYLIRAFVYEEEDGSMVRFESKFYKQRWYFLRVVEKGSAVNLYASPDQKNTAGNMWNVYKDVVRSVNEYWLEFPNEKLKRVYQGSYKKIMRKNFSNYPGIAQKVGQDGYKLNDIKKIVREINELYKGDVKKI